MTIGNDFYLSGFTRIDKGEAGAVFVRYAEEEQDERKPEIEETYLRYGGAGMLSYALSIPLPKPRRIVAEAIVTRTSRSRYTAVVYDEKRIAEFKEDTIGGLRSVVAAFFQESKQNVSRAR